MAATVVLKYVIRYKRRKIFMLSVHSSWFRLFFNTDNSLQTKMFVFSTMKKKLFCHFSIFFFSSSTTNKNMLMLEIRQITLLQCSNALLYCFFYNFEQWFASWVCYSFMQLLIIMKQNNYQFCLFLIPSLFTSFY